MLVGAQQNHKVSMYEVPGSFYKWRKAGPVGLVSLVGKGCNKAEDGETQQGEENGSRLHSDVLTLHTKDLYKPRGLTPTTLGLDWPRAREFKRVYNPLSSWR